MAEIINLNARRKQVARTAKEQLAEQNRTQFGRSKAQKLAEKTEKKKSERHLNDHQLDERDPEK